MATADPNRTLIRDQPGLPDWIKHGILLPAQQLLAVLRSRFTLVVRLCLSLERK